MLLLDFFSKTGHQLVNNLHFLPNWSRDVSRDQKLKMKEIGEWVANLLCLDKQIGISERG